MNKSDYQLPDEPMPGALEKIAVRPIWPLFAIMFAGGWLCYPWFVINGFALGSPTRIKELFIAVAGFVGTLILIYGILYCSEQAWIDKDNLKYILQFVILWKLGIAYWLFILQSRVFDLFEYFGGVAKNGVYVILIGAFVLRSQIIGQFDNVFWIMMVA